MNLLDRIGRLEANLASVGKWQRSHFVHKPEYEKQSLEWIRERSAEESLILRGEGFVGDPSCNQVAVFRNSQDRDMAAELNRIAPELIAAARIAIEKGLYPPPAD